MDYNEYRKARREYPADPSIGLFRPVGSIKADKDRLATLKRDRLDYQIHEIPSRRGDSAYRVTFNNRPGLDGLTFELCVSPDDDGDGPIDEAKGAGYEVEAAASYRRAFDEDNQQRPDRAAVLADLSGYNGRSRLWWVYLPATYSTKTINGWERRPYFPLPAGMARGPAREWVDRKRRESAAAMVTAMEERVNGDRNYYHVALVVKLDGEEIASDSLGLINARSPDEAARYFLDDYADATIDGLKDWRIEQAARLAEEAATLARKAAALLSPAEKATRSVG